ncbi:hypothetical protein ACFPT7_17010 [Acidicapsa dinghuensis]|uniref:Uncharacterized protein n=1 Tax=Acidicapsa dinghuensis TaxID=2218256 RepID=A0ABW1EKT5_9BACT|nr:hypothetical protein [Acidicapsa dinghuensis]
MKSVLRALSGKFQKFTTIACISLVFSAGHVSAQQQPEFQVDFTDAGLVPSHWSLRVSPDGSGHFDSDGGNVTAQQTGHMTVSELHRNIQLSSSLANQIFSVAHSRHFFNVPCESHMKVAFQGTKRFTYTGPDGSGSCTFNYSKDKQIQELGSTLMGVEYTILTGGRLEMLLLHDRLGLDQELESFADALHNGNAADPEVIRDTLMRIADDDQVMDRARKRAHALLAEPR